MELAPQNGIGENSLARELQLSGSPHRSIHPHANTIPPSLTFHLFDRQDSDKVYSTRQSWRSALFYFAFPKAFGGEWMALGWQPSPYQLSVYHSKLLRTLAMLCPDKTKGKISIKTSSMLLCESSFEGKNLQNSL